MADYHFTARPRAIDRIADDVEEMALAARKAKHYVEDHLSIDIGSGAFAELSKNHLDGIYLETRSDYQEVASALGRGSKALQATARLYRDTELRERRRIDGVIERTEAYDSEEDTDWVETPGIRQSHVDGVLADPADAFRESWVDAFRVMDDWVEKITSLGIDVEERTLFGIENPAAGWAEEWEGDWKKFGHAISAIDTVGEFWQRLGAEARATLGRWEGGWSGRAADAAAYWLERNADAMIDHGETMQANAHQLFTSVLAVNEVMAPVFDFLSDLFDALATVASLATEMDVDFSVKDPLGTLGSLLDLVGGKAQQLADLISKALEIAGSVSKAINAVRAAGTLMVGIFEDVFTDSDVSIFTPSLEPGALGVPDRER